MAIIFQATALISDVSNDMFNSSFDLCYLGMFKIYCSHSLFDLDLVTDRTKQSQISGDA